MNKYIYILTCKYGCLCITFLASNFSRRVRGIDIYTLNLGLVFIFTSRSTL